jgi:hypothetical protein
MPSKRQNERKTMDTFMDKLAQKLTAQEMIKANSAADAEELQQLKSQINEYNECLAQMKEIEAGLKSLLEEKTTNSSSDAESVDELVQEGRERMMRLSATGTEQLQRIADEGSAKLEQIAAESSTRLEQVASDSALKLENAKIDTAGIENIINESSEKIRRITDESLAKIQEIQAAAPAIDSEELKKAIGDKIESSNDFVHRECVKVYRNVQAVIVEENAKQAEAVSEENKAVKSKIGKVMGISVAALVFSIAGVVLQVLSIFNII